MFGYFSMPSPVFSLCFFFYGWSFFFCFGVESV